jgi:hypothetical protein
MNKLWSTKIVLNKCKIKWSKWKTNIRTKLTHKMKKFKIKEKYFLVDMKFYKKSIMILFNNLMPWKYKPIRIESDSLRK